MQSMNTDQQTYYSNPTGSHQTTGAYYLQNGIDQQFSMRNPNTFAQQPRMPQAYYNPQGSNSYGQQAIFVPPYLQAAPFLHANGPRALNPSYVNVNVIRPPNETSTGAQGYIGPTSYQTYPNNNLQQTQNIYSHQPFYPYPMTQSYTPQTLSQQTPSQISNQSQYSVANNQQQTQSSQTHQTQTSQQSSIDQQHIAPSQPAQPQEKRTRKPLLIVDPVSQRPVDVQTITSSTNGTLPTTTADDNTLKDSVNDSTVTKPKSTDEANKTQVQAEFRKQVAELMHSTPADKNANQSSTDNQTDVTSTTEKKTENIVPQSTSSASSSRTKSPTPLSTNTTKESTSNISSEKPLPGHPGIRTRSITEDKSNNQSNQDSTKDTTQDEINSHKPLESVSLSATSTSNDTTDNSTNKTNDEIPSTEETLSQNSNTAIQSQSTSSLSNAESLECVTPPQTPTTSNDTEPGSANIEKTPSMSKRYSYSIQELLSKRLAPDSQKRPADLKPIDGVTNPALNRQSSTGSKTGVKGSHISLDKPPLHNRSDNAYKPADQNKIDANNKYLRHVIAILNKVTPQKYDGLLQQLSELELDRYERLEGLIDIIVTKAVNETVFSFLYAKLCKHFEKKQVTVPSENGQTVTHFFRQLLLTRCQKSFEGDYRQDIGYEKRKTEVEAITDEKLRKEKSEELEEDLHKAKRKKLGNIFFIGELFKLNMLTDTIMYDCMEYLLRDKTDEESLECLCRLLRTIGKELDIKADKTPNRKVLEKHYSDLENIVAHRQTSARIRFMIQDLLDLRKANWVARRAEAKPTTIDEIHEEERIKREQQEQDRQKRRDQNYRGGSGGGSNNPQQYTESRGSRGSGVKQQSNRTDDERTENRFTVNSVRQLQSNDKRNQGQILNLAPQHAWNKGSGVDKKLVDDRSNAGKTGKPPAGPVQQLRSKTGTPPGTPGYIVQRQSSRELARENSHRDRENAMQSLRKTTSGSGITSPNNPSTTYSREGSRNVSREQSRNASRESSVSERLSINKISTPSPSTIINTNPLNTSFNEEKTQSRVHSLIEEYTENYSDNSDRPVQEAMDDLSDFCTSNTDQHAIIVRELFTNVFEAKPRARKAVGHLLDVAIHKNIISNKGLLSGFNMIIELVPDYAVDIPLIWQYIGEIVGAFFGAPLSNMLLLKDILQSVPNEKSKPFFRDTIRYATEFSSKARVQRFWQSTGYSLNDIFKSDSIDSSFMNEYNWLSDATEAEPITPIKENLLPRADPQLVKLFKSVNDQNVMVPDADIIAYIHENMNPQQKFYIRNIVLSYLEACLINREPQKKIQEDIAKSRMTILKAIIEHKPEAEIQAVYAIQNFVSRLEHPPKMAQLLFDIFYDDECVSEETFFEWLRHPDQSETEGHSVVEMSTRDFFNWLQTETEADEGEEEES